MKIIQLNDIDSKTLSFIKEEVLSHPDERSFKININSNGGDLDAAFAIYDFIRTSDKEWYTNIEGTAHSASVVVLLSAPLENRSSNPLSTSLIHQVYLSLRGDYNPNELNTITEEMNAVKTKMAGIYADRTNLSLEDALLVIEEEKERDAEWLLENGFVNQINLYKNCMKKNLIMHIKNLLGLENKEVKDAEGQVLFTLEGDEIVLGSEAEPDGEFEVPEVGTVVIKDGVITDILVKEPTEEPLNEEVKETTEEDGKEPVDEEKEGLKQKVEELETQLEQKEKKIEELKVALQDSLDALKEFKATVSSNFVPEKRVTNNKENNFIDIFKK